MIIVETLKSKILAFDIPFITSVRFINTPNDGIAKSRRSTGELVVNRYYFDRLPDEHKLFVLLHEAGHIGNKTVDELTADQFASDMYLNAGFPISESVKALAANLIEDNPVHVARAWAQYQRALEYDYRRNNNQKAFRTHYEGVGEIKQKLKAMAKNDYSPDWTPLLGIAIGKKARARKQDKHEAKMKIKSAKADALRNKGLAKLELAKLGVATPTFGDSMGKALSGAAGLASNILGGGGQSQAPDVQQSMPDLMSQVPPAIFNTGGGRSMGSMAGDENYVPPVNQDSSNVKQAADQAGGGKKPDEPKDNKNKNLPFIIGGIAVAVMVVVVVLMKK